MVMVKVDVNGKLHGEDYGKKIIQDGSRSGGRELLYEWRDA